MATIDATKGDPYVPFSGTFGKFFILENIVDFQALGAASTDTVKALDIPAGTFVIAAGAEVLTPANSATSATLDLGDSADTDRYLAAVNLKSSAGTVLMPSTEASVGVGRVYTSASTIDAVPTYTGTTTQKGKIRVFAVCVAIK